MFGKTDKLQQLQKRSADAIGIFQNTIAKLADTNSEIRAERKRKVDEIAALQSQADELASMEEGNQKFIDKINNFLND